jgi:sugar phosphate isomerase/epimerase
VGWVTRAGYKPVEFIKQFEKRIAYFHIKDTLPEGKWTEVGKGIVDFKSILALLKDLKRDDWLTVERDETLVQAFESAKESREALKALGV